MENAYIVDTFLGYEDQGIFTAVLTLQGDGWNQGFGSYSLGEDNANFTFISGVLNTLIIKSWEDVSGKLVRIKRDEQNSITSIGHPVKNIWFTPKEVL